MLQKIEPIHLRPYTLDDKGACLSLLDSNTPRFFAPHERDEFSTFLDDPGDRYWVVEDDTGTVIACSGYWIVSDTPVAVITWTMVARSWHGRDVGRWLLLTCLHHLCRIPAVQIVTLETSQHVTGFYEQVGGFRVQEITENGYAPGLHKIKMRREMTLDGCATIAQQLAALRIHEILARSGARE
ncbi:MAG TPA: GNAT family N-acetyltransferase [Anaerolineae bacterium]|nr:GNAT family N-acetyltransferase [Anaerolineae bacterium]